MSTYRVLVLALALTGLGVCLVLGMTTCLTGCSKGTHLAPVDQQLVVGAMRANAFGVTRLDGGSPSANRALDRSSCGNLTIVMRHAGADAGLQCP